MSHQNSTHCDIMAEMLLCVRVTGYPLESHWLPYESHWLPTAHGGRAVVRIRDGRQQAFYTQMPHTRTHRQETPGCLMMVQSA